MSNIEFAERYISHKAVWRYWVEHHANTSGISGEGLIVGYDAIRKRVRFRLDGYRYDLNDYHTAEASDLELITTADNEPLPLPG